MNNYLFRFNLHADGNCEHCLVSDTIKHFLFYCSHYTAARDNMYTELQQAGVYQPTLERILNPSRNRNKVFQAVTRFILQTKKVH